MCACCASVDASVGSPCFVRVCGGRLKHRLAGGETLEAGVRLYQDLAGELRFIQDPFVMCDSRCLFTPRKHGPGRGMRERDVLLRLAFVLLPIA